jgi:hypothetical protein
MSRSTGNERPKRPTPLVDRFPRTTTIGITRHRLQTVSAEEFLHLLRPTLISEFTFRHPVNRVLPDVGRGRGRSHSTRKKSGINPGEYDDFLPRDGGMGRVQSGKTVENMGKNPITFRGVGNLFSIGPNSAPGYRRFSCQIRSKSETACRRKWGRKGPNPTAKYPSKFLYRYIAPRQNAWRFSHHFFRVSVPQVPVHLSEIW